MRPRVRTAGLMLVQRSRGALLEQRFNLNKDRNAKLEGQFAGAVNTVSLHAEDIVRGYRIDIWDSASGEWRSLCRRTARYELNGAAVVVDADARGREHRPARGDQVGGSRRASRTSCISTKRWCRGPDGAWPRRRRVARSSQTTSFDKTVTQSEAQVAARPGLQVAVRGGEGLAAATAVRPRVLDTRARRRPRWQFARAAGRRLRGEQPSAHARRYLRYEPVAAPIVALLSPSGARDGR